MISLEQSTFSMTRSHISPVLSVSRIIASAISGDKGCDLELGLVQAKCGFNFQYYLIVACGNTAGARDKATRRANQFNTNGDQKIRATRLRSKENSYRISFI